MRFWILGTLVIVAADHRLGRIPDKNAPHRINSAERHDPPNHLPSLAQPHMTWVPKLENNPDYYPPHHSKSSDPTYGFQSYPPSSAQAHLPWDPRLDKIPNNNYPPQHSEPSDLIYDPPNPPPSSAQAHLSWDPRLGRVPDNNFLPDQSQLAELFYGPPNHHPSSAQAHLPWNPRLGRISDNIFPSVNSKSPDPITISPNRSPSSPQTDVNDIRRLLIEVEKKMQNFCRKHTDRPLIEAYEVSYYRLYANLTGCQEEGLEVRAGQRLVAVQTRNSSCNYIALQLLPVVVDSNSAYWRFENGQLNILFPYSSVRQHCGRLISDSIHSLLKFDDTAVEADVSQREAEVESAQGGPVSPGATEKWYY